MKIILKIVTVCLCAWLFIWLDTLLYDLIVSAIPPTEWMKLIKIGIILVMIIYTSGMVIALTALVSVILTFVIDVVLPNNRGRSNQFLNLKRHSKPSEHLQIDEGSFKKSRFQQKLEQMAEERKKKW